MRNSLEGLDPRLDTEIIVNILTWMARELLPDEYREGKVRVIDELVEYNSYLDDSPLYYMAVYVSVRNEKRSYVFLELHDRDRLGQEYQDIPVSSIHHWNWEEGTIKNQSYYTMKMRLLEWRFNSFIREYLSNR